MARRVKSTTLDSRTARSKLAARDKPYYTAIARGLHLGYRKGKTGGRWVVRCYLDGAYEVETFDNADDTLDANGRTVLDYWQAQAKARQIYDRRVSAAAGEAENENKAYTVKDAMNEYLTYLESHSRSAEDARTRIEAFVVPELGKIEVAKLTTQRLAKWHRDLAKRPPRLRTKKGQKQRHREIASDDPESSRRRKANANRILTYLKAGLNLAWRESGRALDDSVWRKVKPFRDVDAARAEYLTVAQAKRLINVCEPDFRNLVRGALATGCRYSELCRMDVKDYDPDNHQVFVRASKSGKARHVVLNAEGAELFDQLTAGRPESGPIFRRSDGGRWGRAHQTRPFAEARKRAKIRKNISFHGLRHTYASLAIMNGAELIVISHNLGHSDTRMVERHYGHLADHYKAERIRATAPSFGVQDTGTPERMERA